MLIDVNKPRDLKMRDLSLGMIVTSKEIRKFKNYAIVLGHTKKVLDSEENSVRVGEIVYVNRTLKYLDYKEEEDEVIYIKPPLAGTFRIIDIDKEEEADYERLFANNGRG